MSSRAAQHRLMRFALVGVVNTAADIAIFTALRLGNAPIILANTCSTSVGLAISLALNYKFTFRVKSLTKVKMFQFVLVTLIGLWLLQPLVMAAFNLANSHRTFTGPLIRLLGHARLISTIIPKVASIAVTLVWNYLWYSLFIFKTDTTREQQSTAASQA